MSLRRLGTFQTNNEDKSVINEIENSFQDIKNNPEAMKAKIIELGHAIESAKEGGCIRRSGIMGPAPHLEERYRREQQVLNGMLVKFEENNKKNSPKAS